MVIENITNATVAAIGPVSYISGVFNTLKVLVGGIFGLYVILVFLRWQEYVMIRRFLKDMRHDLLQIGKKMGIKETSEHRPRTIQRIKAKLSKNENKNKRRNTKKV